MWDGLAGVFGRAGELERLWSVERCCEANFAGFLGMRLKVYGLDGCRKTMGRTYAFECRFRRQASFGIVLAANGRCTASS